MPRQSFSILIMMPLPSLKLLNLSAAVYGIFTVDSLCYAVTYIWCSWPTCIVNNTIRKQMNSAKDTVEF